MWYTVDGKNICNNILRWEWIEWQVKNNNEKTEEIKWEFVSAVVECFDIDITNWFCHGQENVYKCA